MIISLSKPVSVKDKSLSEISLDLDSLTGKDLIDIEAAMTKSGRNTGAWDASRAFMIRVAAKSAAIPPEALEALPVKDFNKIINQVMLFLLEADSVDLTPQSSEQSS